MLDVVVSIFQSRLAALGLTDSQVAASGGSSTSTGSPAEIHAVVHPSTSDLRSEVELLLGETGQLSFVSLPPTTYGTFGSPGTKPIPVSGDNIDPSLPAQFTGNKLDPNAFVVQTNADCTWAVGFSFGGSASADFEAWSRQHVNYYFAIVLDGRVIAVPYVQSPFVGGKGEINGRFNASSANVLAAILRSGALPYPVQEIAMQPVP
jgi:preprotein translocase subunit SecD